LFFLLVRSAPKATPLTTLWNNMSIEIEQCPTTVSSKQWNLVRATQNKQASRTVNSSCY
jgi:hypothetical protein